MEAGPGGSQNVGDSDRKGVRDRLVQERKNGHARYPDLEGHRIDGFTLGVFCTGVSIPTRERCEARGNSRSPEPDEVSEVSDTHVVRNDTRFPIELEVGNKNTAPVDLMTPSSRLVNCLIFMRESSRSVSSGSWEVVVRTGEDGLGLDLEDAVEGEALLEVVEVEIEVEVEVEVERGPSGMTLSCKGAEVLQPGCWR